MKFIHRFASLRKLARGLFARAQPWLGRGFRVFLIVSMLIPYMTVFRDIAASESATNQISEKTLAERLAKPGTTRALREVSYGPPKIDRPEPRVVMRVLEAPADTIQDAGSVQLQPTPMASPTSSPEGQESNPQGDSPQACQFVKDTTWCLNGSATANASTGVITLTPAENTRCGSAWRQPPFL